MTLAPCRRHRLLAEDKPDSCLDAGLKHGQMQMGPKRDNGDIRLFLSQQVIDIGVNLRTKFKVSVKCVGRFLAYVCERDNLNPRVGSKCRRMLARTLSTTEDHGSVSG